MADQTEYIPSDPSASLRAGVRNLYCRTEIRVVPNAAASPEKTRGLASAARNDRSESCAIAIRHGSREAVFRPRSVGLTRSRPSVIIRPVHGKAQ